MVSGVFSGATPTHAAAAPEFQRSPVRRGLTARASTLDAGISRSGDLQITTADGDTVHISFSTLQQLHAESVRGKSGGARLDYRNAQQSSQVSVNIGVDGSLDSQEIADIGKLLQNLAGDGQDATRNLGDSLNSFTYAYWEQAYLGYSSSQVSARA